MSARTRIGKKPIKLALQGLLLLTAVVSTGWAALFYSHDAPRAAVTPDGRPRPDGSVSMSEDAQARFGLVMGRPEMRELEIRVSAPAFIALDDTRTARIRALGRGRVRTVPVKVGDAVETGRTLLQFDNIDLGDARFGLAAAQAALRRAEVVTDFARRAATRARDLARAGSGPTVEVERTAQVLAEAEASVVTAAAEVQRQEEALRRQEPATGADMRDSGQIAAPFGGILMSLSVATGDAIDSTRDLMMLADTSVVWVQADLPVSQASQVRPGAPADIAVQGLPDRGFAGSVTAVADQVDPRTAMVRVRVDLPNPDRTLKPGMFAQASIALGPKRSALVVPAAALQSLDGADAVFLRLSATEFRSQQVRIGARQGDRVEILEGLSPDDEIVVAAGFRLKAVAMQANGPAGD